MASAEQHYYQTPGHVMAAGIALSLLDISVVALRFMARRKGKQPLRIDDWLLLPATLLTAGVGACLVFGVTREAFGYRAYPTAAENPSQMALYQISMSLKLEWSISLVLPVALACTKASFVFFYRRIFSINKGIDRLLTVLLVIISMWAIAFFFATLFCCKVMLFAIWQPVSEMSQCMFFLRILMAFCITGFITDVIIMVTPIPFVWRLKLSRGQKLLASASFFLGAVTVAAALARLIVSVDFVKTVSDPNSDRILNITLYCYWGMVECSMGVFAACLPTLQLFFRRWAWDALATRTRSLFQSLSSGDYYSSRTRDAIRVDSTVDVISDKKPSTIALSNLPNAGQDSQNGSYTYAAKGPTEIRDAV